MLICENERALRVNFIEGNICNYSQWLFAFKTDYGLGESSRFSDCATRWMMVMMTGIEYGQGKGIFLFS